MAPPPSDNLLNFLSHLSTLPSPSLSRCLTEDAGKHSEHHDDDGQGNQPGKFRGLSQSGSEVPQVWNGDRQQ